jgi:hypothetical protein
MGGEQQQEFDAIKDAIYEAPTLQIPDLTREFIIQCDTSDVGVSSVLNH